jgi:hypothetical protein
MLVGGVAAAYQTGAGSQWHSHPIVRTGGFGAGGLRGWTACTLNPTVSGAWVLAIAAPGKAGGSLSVEVVGQHPGTSGTTFTASVTPTFPSGLAVSQVTLTQVGTSFLLKGKVPVPSTATSGKATLAVAGTYGGSNFKCNLTAKITVPLCTASAVWAYATPAMPGGMLWVAVGLRKPHSSATLTAVTATALIPPSTTATGAVTLAPLGTWPVLVGSFPVPSDSTLHVQATVTVSGTYTDSSATAFTCTLSTPKNIQFWPSLKGSPKGH